MFNIIGKIVNLLIIFLFFTAISPAYAQQSKMTPEKVEQAKQKLKEFIDQTDRELKLLNKAVSSINAIEKKQRKKILDEAKLDIFAQYYALKTYGDNSIGPFPTCSDLLALKIDHKFIDNYKIAVQSGIRPFTSKEVASYENDVMASASKLGKAAMDRERKVDNFFSGDAIIIIAKSLDTGPYGSITLKDLYSSGKNMSAESLNSMWVLSSTEPYYNEGKKNPLQELIPDTTCWDSITRVEEKSLHNDGSTAVCTVTYGEDGEHECKMLSSQSILYVENVKSGGVRKYATIEALMKIKDGARLIVPNSLVKIKDMTPNLVEDWAKDNKLLNWFDLNWISDLDLYGIDTLMGNVFIGDTTGHILVQTKD
jgi:hypothetical protein